MIEVFKTNIESDTEAASLREEMHRLFPSLEVSFDLEDCDRVLRAEATPLEIIQIPMLLAKYGFECEVLEG